MSNARQLAANLPREGGLSNRNLIINGAMQVAQRGTSFSSIGSATYTLDRWRGQSRAGSVINVSKVDNVDVDGRTMSVLQHQVATPATDGLTLQNHFVEDGSIALLGQTVTVSCWARVTSGSATLEHRFEVDTGIYAYKSGVTTLTSSFQRIVFTTTLSGYTTSISDKHLRYMLYIRDASAHTVQITGVQLEVGDTATPFEHRSYGDELARCRRFFWAQVPKGEAGGGAGNPAQYVIADGGYLGNGQVEMHVQFPVEMRAAPSFSVSSGTDYFVSESISGNDYFNTLTGWGAKKQTSLVYQTVGVSGTAGDYARIAAVDSSAYVYWDAEL